MATQYGVDEDIEKAGDREISLGTTTVLGIFFGLAVVCALFFGLGYSMGRKSAPGQAAIPAGAAESAGPAEVTGSRPTTASERGSGSRKASAADIPPGQTTEPDRVRPDTESGSADSVGASGRRQRDLATQAREMAPAPAGGVPLKETYVQVAAVTHREDAELLLGALRRRGYQGAIRQAGDDKLLHVQLGPFPTKKEAEALKQRLTADGYNPILK